MECAWVISEKKRDDSSIVYIAKRYQVIEYDSGGGCILSENANGHESENDVNELLDHLKEYYPNDQIIQKNAS